MPIPKFKMIRQMMGYSSERNLMENGIPSNPTNKKNMIRVSPKLIREETFRENRNKYFGTFTLVKYWRYPLGTSCPYWWHH